MTGWARYIGWQAAVLGLVFFAYTARPPKDAEDGLHWTAFGELPIVDGGRVKPIDTFARVTLQIISGKQDVVNEKDKVQATAVQWLTEVWSSPDPFSGPAAKRQVFRITELQLLKLLQLEPRPGFYRYSLAELQPKYDVLDRLYAQAHKERVDKRPLDERQVAILDLGDHLEMYQRVVQRRTPLVLPPQDRGQEWQAVYDAAEPFRNRLVRGFMQQLRDAGKTLDDLTRAQLVRVQIEASQEALTNLYQEPGAVAAAFQRMVDAAIAKDVKKFNQAITEYRATYYPQLTDKEERLTRFESKYNHAQLFFHCAVMYGFVLGLAAISWMGAGEWLRRPALGLASTTFIVHTVALIARMVIQGRPPVTNLYSSAIFIGWGGVGLLILLECLYRNGIPAFLAGAAGLGTLIIAHFLSLSGDTLEMMQAVLDTNFWLATHVTTVTLGYTASSVAGLIGVIYILRGVLTPTLSPQAGKSMADMTYGVVCFAMLLSFVGTVLGGIWADYSWGRFWGWDPKENGAVLIVIWNALILHARWAGLVKQRGLAILAAFGIIVTGWSWFGTNQLGVGLHAYGFTSGVANTLVVVDLLTLAIMGIGMLPSKCWWSNQVNAAMKPKAEVTRTAKLESANRGLRLPSVPR